jgi:SSS family solute:Na+ symporter
VFLIYFLIVSCYGFGCISRKHNADATSKDYFLAEGSLTWWAIGASLIASNISAEQFIAMSGIWFYHGIGYLHLRVDGRFTLVIVAVFFIPVYLKNKIFTMPQFLHQRYNSTVAMIMAMFWLLLYVIVNLTSILVPGRNCYQWHLGDRFSAVYSRACNFCYHYHPGWNEGYWLYRCYPGVFPYSGRIGNNLYSGKLSSEFYGHYRLAERPVGHAYTHANDHFQMVLKKDNPSYGDLPGLTVL